MWYDPDGTDVERFDVPAGRVTSVAFGARDLDRLYATTGGSDRPTDGPDAGALFRLDPDVGGCAEFRSAVEF